VLLTTTLLLLSQDQLLNVIYWWRQVSGVLLGILIGMFGITGLYGMVM
jgi:hypothetical protein